MIGGIARDHRATILVAALGSAFGVALLGVVSLLEQMATAQHPTTSGSDDGALILQMMAIVFLCLSIYVGAIVTANTFSTVVAGRTASIALMRLLGDTARAQRNRVVRESARIGVIGSLIGALIGLLLEFAYIRFMVMRDLAPDVDYTYLSAVMAFPVAAVVLATVIAGRVGSRAVLRVSPMEATASAHEATEGDAASRHGRHVIALVLFLAGDALLGVGIAVGLSSPTGVLIGLVGGILSFSGVVAAADVVMPTCLRLVGRLFGRSPSARLAAANSIRHPDRSARSTIGMVVGVTLVVTFAVTLTTFESQIVAAGSSPDAFSDMILVFTCLTGFSAVIAAVGMVDTLSLSVHQRRRELGLLRTLGFTRHQVRWMILAEAGQMAVTSVVLGLLLGTFYGWCGAQSALGSVSKSIVLPTVPVGLVAGLALAALLLAAIASLAPSRRATRVTPVTALRAS